LALGLSALYPRGRLLFLTTAALVAAERVVFCAHYVSDVLAGAGLAWLVVSGLFRNRRLAGPFERLERRESPPRTTTPISRAA
jgi:membrane-associated phospholipid phosphatase